MKILVDADSCPVKQEIVDIGNLFDVQVIMVSNLSHRMEGWSKPGVTVVQVDNQAEAVDIKIANEARPWDVVISADYGLAALVLSKGAAVLTPRGAIIDHHNINNFLQERFVAARMRRGGKRTKGPRPFTMVDRRRFSIALQTLVRLGRGKEGFS